MSNQFTQSRIFRFTIILLFITLMIYGAVKAADFLQPIAIALLLAFLLVPISRGLEKKGMSRGWSSGLATLVSVAFLAIVIGLISFQANQMSKNWDQLQQKGEERLEEIKSSVITSTGLTKEQVEKLSEGPGYARAKNVASSIMAKMLNSITDLLLIFIYTFLILLYRKRFKNFILKLNHEQPHKNAEETLRDSAEAARGYLKAKFMLIGILSVIYAIGLTLLGVKSGIFYGVLAALLTIIPYIGNILGAAFPLVMAILYNDTTTAVLVLGLFILVQLLESYVLQPLLVKKEVDLNPFFSIAVAILGGIVWGIPGLIIAIPYLAIAYIIFRHIDGMEPFSYVLSEDD